MDGFMDGLGINLLIAMAAQILVAIGLFVIRFAIRKVDEFVQLPFTKRDKILFPFWFMIATITHAIFMVSIILGNIHVGVFAFVAWLISHFQTTELFYKYYYVALKKFENEKPEKSNCDKSNNA